MQQGVKEHRSRRDACLVAAESDTSRSHPHLRLVEDHLVSVRESELTGDVRGVRRDMGRLLRALQASGRGVTTWPDEVVTRLAHVDAVTARFLISPESADDETVLAAAGTMRALERWVTNNLSSRDLAEVRAFALMIRIEDADLEAPLLRPDGSPEEQSPTIAVAGGLPPRSVRGGLRYLDDEELSQVCRRLGVRPLDMEPPTGKLDRSRMEEAVIRTLRDDHLLSILIATLSPETHELLGALVRGRLSEAALEALAEQKRIANVSGGDTLVLGGPVEHLTHCGLLFSSGAGERPRFWVPVELQRRVDGVLRAFGI